MQQTSPEKLLFVINPKSGGKEKTDHENAIVDYFKSLPHQVEYFELSNNNDSRRLASTIKKLRPDKVIAVGGDGTVTMVAKAVQETRIVMGIIPAGSANGMAAELQIPETVTDALDIILHGEVKKVDLININDQVCLHLSDIGLNARLIKYFEEGNMRGKMGYAKVALKVLSRKQHMQVIIKVKGEVIQRAAFMVVLANASKYGTGAVINPEGSLYDGLFEVVIIRRLNVWEILKMWFKPKPFNPRNIEIVKAESVSIVTGHRVHFQVDGEYIGKVRKVNASILPGVLNIVLPKEKDIV
jgi:diacylglycerol kinase (ATP)